MPYMMFDDDEKSFIHTANFKISAEKIPTPKIPTPNQKRADILKNWGGACGEVRRTKNGWIPKQNGYENFSGARSEKQKYYKHKRDIKCLAWDEINIVHHSKCRKCVEYYHKTKPSALSLRGFRGRINGKKKRPDWQCRCLHLKCFKEEIKMWTFLENMGQHYNNKYNIRKIVKR